ncbi:tetratricopeptide repeat protein [Candidatus Woesearchaeota archaeon]|jgi:tetratricopeptide (TPR) repeat protein|nr:tetratricopeptide repeat protein [Candidatus Woesearchaeota archaeon]
MSNIDKVNKAKEEAYKLMFEDHKLVDGLAILLELIETDEVDWNVYYLLGQGYRFINDFEGSIKFLSKAVDLNSDEAPVFHALGVAYQLNKNYDTAIEKFQIAIDMDPTNFSVLNSIGLTFKKIGDPTKALYYYSKAGKALNSNISKDICNPESLCYKDEIIDGKKTRTTLPYYLPKLAEALKSTPEYAINRNNMGSAAVEMGKAELARGNVKEVDKFFKLARENFEESIGMTPVGYTYPDPRVAIRELDKLEEMSPIESNSIGNGVRESHGEPEKWPDVWERKH